MRQDGPERTSGAMKLGARWGTQGNGTASREPARWARSVPARTRRKSRSSDTGAPIASKSKRGHIGGGVHHSSRKLGHGRHLSAVDRNHGTSGSAAEARARWACQEAPPAARECASSRGRRCRGRCLPAGWPAAHREHDGASAITGGGPGGPQPRAGEHHLARPAPHLRQPPRHAGWPTQGHPGADGPRHHRNDDAVRPPRAGGLVRARCSSSTVRYPFSSTPLRPPTTEGPTEGT